MSVADKQGITELAKSLHKHGVELISTGGTANTLRDAGLPVKDVSEITGFPECLDGRVKTLHPKVHGGILARTSYEPDNEELQQLDIKPIELVVVNLYPFKEVVGKPDTNLAKATEFIDIGGPTMVRASAKNFAHVCILTSPQQYEAFSSALNSQGAISFSHRARLALSAFQHTADYDMAISEYLNRTVNNAALPQYFQLSLPKTQETRYGENPHQKAAVYGHQDKILEVLHGKELSYNNYLDIDAALRLISDFSDDNAAAIFKHTNPCGVAIAEDQLKAFERAFRGDRVSPFGGIFIVNSTLTLAAAKKMDEIFSEIILAPSFSADALELLLRKKNRRLIRYSIEQLDQQVQVRSIAGGILVQEQDLGQTPKDDMKVVTARVPSPDEWHDALFAWKVVKHVKSNAIVYAREGMTLGIGVGQTSRVDSAQIAVRKAELEELSLQGSAVASDAFYPFADGVEAAAKAGATCVIQPGGSVRDEEVIAAANRLGLAMIFTGRRHFKH